jgi:amino acid permease
MIYLSWSIAKLAMHLLVLAAAYACFMWKGKEHRSFVSKVFAALLILTLYVAFDVGTRQQDLQRGSFDAQAPALQEKVSRETMDRNTAKQTFEKAVKESK